MTQAAPLVEQIQKGELPCWRIRIGRAEAVIACQGAHILSFGLDGEQPIIWDNPDAEFIHGQPIRGGVPVCWPWFGDIKRNPPAVQHMLTEVEGAPQHGLVRQAGWATGDMDVDVDRVRLDFHYQTSAAHMPGWPHAADLTLSAEVSDRLTMTLTTRNIGDQTLTLSQALHTYFAVSDSRQVGIEGFTHADYYDCLDGWERKRQNGEPVIDQEVDRVYQGLPSRLGIRDPEWNRRIFIETKNTSSAVLWNPWIEKSKRLTPFADDAWQRMLCIETARVMDDVMVLAPGETGQISATLWSEPL
ncbi:D-hexose-6-phosphate mutarotase [Pseudomonas sp. JZ134]|uniref:D-hexose-6-phosphate mutarotase n=1 Tax=Pseudomonas sp. JZ134 TaxID=2806615 RepID=UPI003DA0E1A1